MSLKRHGLPGDRASGSCGGPARAFPAATNVRSSDEFVAFTATLADPPSTGRINERLPHRGGRAYLTLHVRR